MRRKELSTLLYFPSVEHPGRIAIGEQTKEDLEHICDALNSTKQPELRDKLRELVETWRASGPNLEKMMYGNLDLFHKVRTACSAAWTPQDDGRALLHLVPNYSEHIERKSRQRNDGTWEPTPEAEALVLFHFLTLNPQWEKLAGPCARCGNYYVKKRASQKVYCSRRCGNAATALARTRDRLKTDHEDKMRRARAAIQVWNSQKRRPTLAWKQWLKRREPDITEKFVTRWVNKDELPRPKETRRPESI